MKRVKFLNSFIDNVSMKEAINIIDGFVASGRPHQLVAVNATKIVKMQKDKQLRDLVNSSDLVFADGQAVVTGSRILGSSLKQRLAGIDLMQEIVRRANTRKYSLYFLGAKEHVVRKLVDIYKERFPELEIAGWHDGYFESADHERKVIQGIKGLRPDVLFVAMGTPKKEYWIRQNLEELGIPVCLGVGGSFDVIAGYVKRAPKWMQGIGLEWFFRFLSEPRRMWKRYLFSNTTFIWMVMREKIALRKTIAAFFLLALAFFPLNLFQAGEKEWFPFYVPWNYCKNSAVDVSFLLDAPAGKHGFVAVKDGHFYFKDGIRARFWGVNIHSNKTCFPSHGQAEDIAKRLAQLGCNIVRMHLLDYEEPYGIIDSNYNDSQHLSASQLEKMDYFIYQLKENGIYVTFDVLGLGARRFKEGDGVVDHNKIKSGAGGISFFDERIIELSRKFAKDFLSHVNSYTGNSYLDEPAIAMIEMTNENTLFGHWIIESFTPHYKKKIDGLWKEWLKGNSRGSENIYSEWYEDRRFKFELQNSYQEDMYDYLRSIGVKCPIGSSNYTHDNLNLAADKNMDFTDIHLYWDHPYKVNRIHNRALIKQSHLNPETLVNMISRASVFNKPLIVTEWDSIWPNEWRAVDVLSTASYAALNEVDALFLYSYNGGWEISWDDLEKKIYYPTVVFNDPAKMGLFPLGALIFLRGDVAPAVHTRYASYGMDELYQMSEPYSDWSKIAGVAYVSRLEKKIHASDEGIYYPYIAEIFRDEGKVISDTGEITRDSKRGVFIVKAPRIFSFSGFIGSVVSQQFNGIRFASDTDFATFTVTSLNEKDISGSDRLLVTVVGRVRNKSQRLTPHITKKSDDLKRDVYVLDKGQGPILVEGVEGVVSIKKRRKKENVVVFALDEKGLRQKPVPVNIKGESFTFKVSGEHQTIYYEIERI
ncbi:MAG: WecB/TagA/CpsF family glycosyltransferase [Candidatus Gorgyraea atricola]|nr:WecB/TagA/CpsF family glycosyltransferase [Candidatus Gorgyraea atricola]